MKHYAEINRKLYERGVGSTKISSDELKGVIENLKPANYPKIHIAGTNGKSSCARKISHALTRSGYRCGLFTSPHIITFRERILVDGEMISKREVEAYFPFLLRYLESLSVKPDFFEIMTLAALYYFTLKEVDVAVFETGIGGRSDATNCILPILSIITSISYDHMAILGDSLEEIAFEKAGIIKPHVPVIIGPRAPQCIIKQVAQKNEAPYIRLSTIEKDYEKENQHIATIALEGLKKQFHVTNETIEEAVQIKPPCRFEVLHRKDKTVIFDMACREESLLRFFEKLQMEFKGKKKTVFFALPENRDRQVLLRILQRFSQDIYLLDKAHPGVLHGKKLREIAQDTGNFTILPVAEWAALLETLSSDPLYVCCGSSVIMKDFYHMIGKGTDEDPYDFMVAEQTVRIRVPEAVLDGNGP